MSEQVSQSGEAASFPVLQARLVDEVCDRFESAWKQGRRPRIEDFLNPALRSMHEALLPELLALELAYRRDSGERPSAAEYRQRFPKHGPVIRAVWQNLAERGRTTAPATVAGVQAKTMSAKPSPTMHTPADADAESPPATGPEEAAPPAAGEPEIPLTASGWPEIPGYQILGKLGEGGMGVVYRARQAELNRLVALKMIRPARAGEQGVARFRVEAEAVARMQHPNVVQIFEIGEHAGQPFFSLEFVEGGSLADRLDGTPWPGSPAASLVETLACAMEAAHRRQIIHRDLKPANILLTADYTPKITDFGLAKRLDGGAGQTQSGVIMGTPSYMAPEQAQGKNDEVGPAADVYALGAILYELLTGRPPFKAATPLDTVLQVVSGEPVPPRRLQPKTPRDLETICLKCLEKNPSRRYASAAVLAKDLRFFREGRPITTRPVGQAERAARWVRRNPVVSGLLAAVVVVVIFGLVFSTYFAVDAAQKAEQARWNEGEAKRSALEANAKKIEAEAARTDLETANQGLVQSKNDLERMVAGSLLQTLAAPGYGRVSPAGPETEVLWKLVGNRKGQFWKVFIDEAIKEPITAYQLQLQAEYALHAAVGLELDKREQVEQLLASQLQNPEVPTDQRTDLVFVAAVLGHLSRKTSTSVAQGLVEASITTSTTGRDSTYYVTFRKGDSSFTPQKLWKGLAALAPRLDPPEAARIADQIIHAMSKIDDPGRILPLMRGLAAVAARLNPRDAAICCAAAADVLGPVR